MHDSYKIWTTLKMSNSWDQFQHFTSLDARPPMKQELGYGNIRKIIKITKNLIAFVSSSWHV